MIDQNVPQVFHIFEIVGVNQAGVTKTARIGFQVVHNTQVGSDFQTAAEFNREGLNFVGLEFSYVASSGNTLVDLMLNGPPPPSGFAIQSFSGSRTYLDITTTATINGPITITIDFDGRGLTLAQEQNMKLFHFNENSGEWEDITLEVDSDNDRIIGIANSLSTFAILSPLDVNNGQVIGGKIIPIDSTSLLVSNVQSVSWMIPVTLSV